LKRGSALALLTISRRTCACKSCLFALIAAFFLTQATSSAQSTIAVRVIKASNGKPLRGYHAWLQFRGSGQRKSQRLTQETMSDGAANFQLAEPLPETIFVSLGVGDAACSGQASIVMRQLQDHGVAVGEECGPTAKAKRISPKPWEIILFVRPMPLWARILAPIERE
jgi:hypothetical protein